MILLVTCHGVKQCQQRRTASVSRIEDVNIDQARRCLITCHVQSMTHWLRSSRSTRASYRHAGCRYRILEWSNNGRPWRLELQWQSHGDGPDSSVGNQPSSIRTLRSIGVLGYYPKTAVVSFRFIPQLSPNVACKDTMTYRAHSNLHEHSTAVSTYITWHELSMLQLDVQRTQTFMKVDLAESVTWKNISWDFFESMLWNQPLT